MTQPTPPSSRRWLFPAVLILVGLVGAGLLVFFVFFYPQMREQPLPKPGTPAYQEYAEAFEVGVAALDTGSLYDLATDKLTEAVNKVPQEPAGWADRGLARLRRNQLNEAAADLEEARKRAPENADIQGLLGYLAQRRGGYDEAADHFRKALQSNPRDVQTRYSLVQVLRQQGGPENDAQEQKELQEILRIQPDNLLALVELVGVAARRKDAEGVKEALDHLGKLKSNWKAETVKYFEALEKAAKGPLPGQVPAALIPFGNILKGEPNYSRHAEALRPQEATVGEPIRRFIRLEPLRPTPAPADTGLTFTAEPLKVTTEVAGKRWEAIQVFWPTEASQAVVLVGDGKEVRQASTAAPEPARPAFAGTMSGPAVSPVTRITSPLPFPGGPEEVPPTNCGIVPFDWNNDYRTDLLFAGAGGLRFFEQGEGGQFKDVTGQTKLDRAVLDAAYYGAWAADYDMDGDLDIIAAPVSGPPVVLRNNRDGTFTVVKLFPGVSEVRAFAWGDLDNDGAADAAFLDKDGKLHVFMNEHLSRFRRRDVPAELGKGLALAVANLTEDSRFSLLVLQADGQVTRLAHQNGSSRWETARVLEANPNGKADRANVSSAPGEAALHAADLDNNGAVDLILSLSTRMTEKAGGRPVHRFVAGEATFALGEANLQFQKPMRVGITNGALPVDLTDSGRLDLVGLDEQGKPVRFVNHGSKAYHWLTLRPRAQEVKSGDDRVNSFGVGGEAEVKAGTLVQKQPIRGPRVHFGLGEQTAAGVVRIQWPNGSPQFEFGQKGNEVITSVQRLKGSCPFLLADGGRGLEFVTDFMWSTPLGMYINAQDQGGVLQTLEWLKVRDDQLKAKDGKYELRVLANLWETHYFDHLSLMTVDHPADTEMYVDERFFLTPTKPAIHVTGPSRPVARARDQEGRDVTDLVRARDGRYLDTFPLGRFQGIARDHWVEVDLGDDAPTEGPLWLLANGWVHPTDSSINAAIEQGNHEKPKALELEVPDGKGGWKVALPALGFPAGKFKTMLIRLDGITGPGVTRRFRLRTNMEVYWDALAYARGLDDKLARLQTLAPDVAELGYHGVVPMTAAHRTSPEIPQYDRIYRGQPWRDLEGYYTRYGDVRELLKEVDDRYVILNAGDELVLQFRAPDGPPPGWKRDFVWVSDGWVKDGDPNTRFCKTVLPLPAHGMTSYNQPPGRLEDDPVYRRFPQDWQRYHTRFVTPERFEMGLRGLK